MVNNVLQDYYTWLGIPEKIQHKIHTTTRILFEPDFHWIRTHSEARSVLKSLEEECDHPDLPFITEYEALVLLDTIAPSNPTVASLIIPSRFPNSKFCLLTQFGL